MRVLTYASYNEHNDLYTKIQSSIAVNGCLVGLAQKDIMLLSKVSLIVYKLGKHAGVKNIEFIKFTLSEGTYSIDDFNAKFKIAILEQNKNGNHLRLKI